MVLRRTAPALEAERAFRKLAAYRAPPTLVGGRRARDSQSDRTRTPADAADRPLF